MVSTSRFGRAQSIRGFTLIECAAIAALVGVGATVFGVMSAQPPTPPPPPAQPPGNKPVAPVVSGLLAARQSARQLKCSTQVRGMVTAMVVWAGNNNSQYPLPSQIDTKDQTVKDKGRAKDTTANILSLLIFNGNISPEICICPEEQSKSIKTEKNYEYTNPKAAVKPPDAFWDPAFNADFTADKGRVSYAHLQPSGDWVVKQDKDGKAITEPTGRLKMWSDTFDRTQAVVSDRGPEIESVSAAKADDPATYKVKTKLAESVTFKIHGDPKTWEGNVGFNDNHVNFVTTLGPENAGSRQYAAKEGKRFDTIFFDEPDDAAQENTFLGLFVKAGKTPKDFKAIWD